MLDEDRYKDVDRRRELITKYRPDLAAQIQSSSTIGVAQEESSSAIEHSLSTVPFAECDGTSKAAEAA